MREELLKYLAPDEERFEFDGKVVVIREMNTALEVEEHQDHKDAAYRMTVRCVLDLDGNPVFTDADIPALKKSSSKKFAKLLFKVMAVNGLDLKEQQKNSEAGAAAG